MEKNLTFNCDFDDAQLDVFEVSSDFSENKQQVGIEKIVPIHSEDWTIIDALSVIYEELPNSQLKKELFVRCAEAFNYLSNKLGFNSIQSVIIALIAESGFAISFRQIGVILGLSRLSMMKYHKDIEELFESKWLIHRGDQDSDGTYDCYELSNEAARALRENRPLIPEELKCNNTKDFVEKLTAHLEHIYNEDDFVFSDDKIWIAELINSNKSLPICQIALSLENNDSMSLFMLIIADYYVFNGTKNEGIGPREVKLVYPRKTTKNFHRIVTQMRCGTHELFRKNLIKHKCVEGIANVDLYIATNHLKKEILSDFVPDNHYNKQSTKINGLIACKSIVEKKLYYNTTEGEQVKRLQALLSRKQLPLVQARLKEKGMRTGICILMHGAPGTGKTATVFELARQTGRDIIQVNVTDFKDKYVGESEAKLKRIFNRYRTLCKNRKDIPILLLNEGDAILSKRLTNIERSVDQMSNALQNILLEEMENLKGIMIVTTNLTDNLDNAFERRFIFKIQFDKPGVNVRAHIWKTMIGELNDNELMELAETFDITGGEIENIARKCIMEYALTGKKLQLGMIKAFANEEKLKTDKRPVIGFMGKVNNANNTLIENEDLQ